MDFISHGLWGAIAFGRKNRTMFSRAFAYGMLPDLLSFGLFFVLGILGFAKRPDWSNGPPPPEFFPEYLSVLYNLTHSYFVFILIFLVICTIRKRFIWEALAWPLHITFDIFTHSSRFFPTPFLWPFSEYTFEGIPWSHPPIFISNLLVLLMLCLVFYHRRKKKLPL